MFAQVNFRLKASLHRAAHTESRPAGVRKHLSTRLDEQSGGRYVQFRVEVGFGPCLKQPPRLRPLPGCRA